MTNDEKAEIIAERNGNQRFCKNCDDCCKPYNSTDDCFKSAMQMAVWKDEQYRIDKTHLNMVYEALNRLYQVRYGDKPILNTGSQTDVFLYMIEDIINDTKPKIKL